MEWCRNRINFRGNEARAQKELSRRCALSFEKAPIPSSKFYNIYIVLQARKNLLDSRMDCKTELLKTASINYMRDGNHQHKALHFYMHNLLNSIKSIAIFYVRFYLFHAISLLLTELVYFFNKFLIFQILICHAKMYEWFIDNFYI